MTLRRLIDGPVFKLLMCATLVLALSRTYAAGKTVQRATSDDLGGKERHLAYVCTDKPIYRMGEKVYVRSVVLDAADRTPQSDNDQAFFKIIGPKGEMVTSGYASSQDSAAGFSWEIPGGQAGGEYTVEVSYPRTGVPPSLRKFDIRAFRAPRLKTQIKFFRDGYGPGDIVGATLEVTRAEGGVPQDARVTVTARIDGAEVHRSTTVVNRSGHCSARFSLPDSIERGEGTLAFAVEDGGVVETATKTIPILLQTVDLTIYPEGGNVVASLPNRLYLEARTPFGKPADIAGIILDSGDNQVGAFRTEHEGRGRFTFIPANDESYHLRITEPSGIDKTFPLPPVKARGVLIQATEDVYGKGNPVRLKILSTIAGPLTVSLSKREQELAVLPIRGNSEDGENLMAEATLTPPASAAGVLIATAWDAAGNPLAERLIYRQPDRSLQMTVEADRDRYVPGEKVELTITATDDAGNPVEAVVGLTVTDDSVLEMIEKREQAPRLPVMVLLESDVKELADAHVYLDRQNPRAPIALDLLLGTQGWRRFAFVDVVEFLDIHGDDARRMLAMKIVTRREQKMLRKAAGGPMLMGMAVNEAMPMAAAEVHRGALVDDLKMAADAPVEKEEDEDLELGEELRVALEVAQDRDDADMIFAERMPSRSKRARRYVSVRIYAHQARSGREPGDRIDFTETLYWHAGIKTDGKTGRATVSFDLNDSVTSFRVFSDGFNKDGALGTHSTTIESVQPFYVEPKLPLEVTMGDRILLPIGVVNGTDKGMPETVLAIAAAAGINVSDTTLFAVAGNERVRRIVEMTVGDIAGNTDFVLSASSGPYADRVSRKLRVAPRGFPIEVAHGGMLKPDTSMEFTISIPETRIPGSVVSDIAVYPTPLASLTEAMERLIREPCGCFEQTSSTTYPLIMAQQYFLSHQGVDPGLIERSREILDRGYQQLTGFECKKNGYEWFGADPAHEALTAYGLLEFTDMAKVRNVDPEMLKRTRQWLLGTRDGKGGFKRERRALHTWIAEPDCSNAYIIWALLQCGETPDSLRKEIDGVKAAALASRNSYVVALGANVALADSDPATAGKLMARLAASQTGEGCVEGATTSIVGSGGEALLIETTSLAVLAWLKDPGYAGAVEKSMKWLADSCKAGRYGSTQSTVLALRAILAYDQARSRPKAPGSIQLFIDGHIAGSLVEFNEDTHGPIKLTDIAEMLEPGKHVVKIRMTAGSEMPFSLAVDYSAGKPDSSDDCNVALSVVLVDREVAEGAVTEARVTMTNLSDEAVPTPIAIIGIPGGLEVRHDQLKELVKAELIASYEVLGRDIVLYWRSLKAGQKVALPISFVAEIPGTYTGPASRAYQYYTDEHKNWVEPMKVRINPVLR